MVTPVTMKASFLPLALGEVHGPPVPKELMVRPARPASGNAFRRVLSGVVYPFKKYAESFKE